MLYIAVRKAGVKYVIRHSSEQAYKISVEKSEEDVWYFTSEKSIEDFAGAGVFGAYDSFESASAAIYGLDPQANVIYKPPSGGTQ